jgi:hypothetical protein
MSLDYPQAQYPRVTVMTDLKELRDLITSLPKDEKDLLFRNLPSDEKDLILHNIFNSLSKYDKDTFLSECQEKQTRKRRPDFSDEEILLYEALEDLFRIDRQVPPMSSFVSTYGATKYSEKTAQIFHYIKDARTKLNSRNLTKELLTTILTCLMKYMTRKDVPVTMTNLLNMIDHLALAVDRSFPGYAEAGFLHRIV